MEPPGHEWGECQEAGGHLVFTGKFETADQLPPVTEDMLSLDRGLRMMPLSLGATSQ